ncbi:MAG TPA: TfoX/Sxy family protein [Gemmatimonadota bacterium]|nr:TfoX/Sxy family protein [Gemmatimonadota bacterium]
MSPEFRAFVEDQIGRVMPVRSRPMFGGLGLYSGDLFFAVVDDDVLYFKVDDVTRPRYEKRRMRPFNPMGTPMNGYWQVPAGVLEDVEELASWVREAVEVAGRAKAKPRRPRSTSRKVGKGHD